MASIARIEKNKYDGPKYFVRVGNLVKFETDSLDEAYRKQDELEGRR